MKLLLIVLASILLTGCEFKQLNESTYVLIRYNNITEQPALRAYFIDGTSALNQIDCEEILKLASEAVDARMDNGELNLNPYKCVTLDEARKLGFK